MTKSMGWVRALGVLVLLPLAACNMPAVRGAEGAPSSSVLPRSAPGGTSSAASPATSGSADYPIAAVRTFLAKVKAAETIKDPLQRCLAYPDPPGSHWPRDTTVAYCRYRSQPLMSANEIYALIRNGHAAELDRRMAAALQAQRTRSKSHGLLDETYRRNFSRTTAEQRALLDRWKHDSPASAFAYAASGYAYEATAGQARGTDYLSNTPRLSVDAMQRMLDFAEVDLRHAIELEPHLTPAYVALIEGGNMGRDGAYLDDVGGQALSADASDYSIYSSLMIVLQPNWHGSLEGMQQLAVLARAHVAENPLLRLVLTAEPVYVVHHCNCDVATRLAAYEKVFDQPAPASDFSKAAANLRPYPGKAAVYMSEALRFDPLSPSAADRVAERALRLSELGEPRWALSEADRVLGIEPDSAGAYKVRALAHEALGNDAAAVQALERAVALDPSDIWSAVELANMYVDKTHQLSEARRIADGLINDHPDDPRGWVIRANVQSISGQPGLDDTIHYFLEHFGNDPEQQDVVAQMRQALAEEAAARAAKH